MNLVVDPDDNMEQIVEKVIEHAGGKDNREYLVRFAGQQQNEVWMDTEDVQNERDIV